MYMYKIRQNIRRQDILYTSPTFTRDNAISIFFYMCFLLYTILPIIFIYFIYSHTKRTIVMLIFIIINYMAS